MQPDMRALLQAALKRDTERIRAFLMALPEDVFRRGAQVWAEKEWTSAQKTAQRRYLASLEPDEFEKAVDQMVKETSRQEAMARVLGGRNANNTT